MPPATSSLVKRLGRGFIAAAAVGALAGLTFGAESLHRNPLIERFGERAIVLLFFPFLYMLVGGGVGLLSSLGLCAVPGRVRTRIDGRGGPVSAGFATALFFFLEGMGRCYECHQWYRDIIPSMTITVSRSFTRFLALGGGSLLAGLVTALLLAALFRWIERGRPPAGRRLAALAAGLFPCALLVLVSFTGKAPGFRPPAYDPTMVRPGALKVRLIVMDGADWDFVEPVLRAGGMPNLQRLIDRGVRGDLGIDTPTISPFMWTNLSTGLGDDVHGLCDFFAYRPPGTEALITRYPGVGNSKRFVFRKLVPKLGRRGIGAAVYASSAQKRVPELWDYLGDAGRSVCVLGWRYSWPATPVRGVMLTERFGNTDLEQPICFPEELKDRLPREFHDEAEVEVGAILGEEMAHRPPEELGLFRRRVEKLRYQVERDIKFTALGRALVDSLEPDFTAVGLTAIDAVEHAYIVEHVLGREENRPPLNGYYRRFTTEEGIMLLAGVVDRTHRFWDRLLGDLVESAGEEEVVFLVSDHGHDLDGSGHRFGPRGIVVAAGGPVDRDGAFENATIYDIAPTVLHLSGLPIPAGLRGRVLTGILDEAWLAANPVRLLSGDETKMKTQAPGEALPELSEEELQDLKALGYVD